MNLIAYFILTQLILASPLVGDTSDSLSQTSTQVDYSSASTPTEVATPVYPPVPGPSYASRPRPKWGHRHRHHHASGKYPAVSPTPVVNYTVQPTSTTDDNSGSESTNASLSVPPANSNKLNVSIDSNISDSTNNSTTNAIDSTPTTDQSATQLPAIYNQIQASVFGDV